MDLTSLRKTIRAQRRRLSPDECTLFSNQIAARLFQQDYFTQSQHIACYCAFDGEVETKLIIDTILENSKQCYLPVIDKEDKSLHFYEYQKGDPLTPNCLGILEPKAENSIAATDLELVLLPIVAFDSQGHRLGTGGGYYDRSIAFVNQSSRKPLLVSLAYEWQRIEQLPTQPWDVDMDIIVTDQHCYPMFKDIK